MDRETGNMRLARINKLNAITTCFEIQTCLKISIRNVYTLFYHIQS